MVGGVGLFFNIPRLFTIFFAGAKPTFLLPQPISTSDPNRHLNPRHLFTLARAPCISPTNNPPGPSSHLLLVPYLHTVSQTLSL